MPRSPTVYSLPPGTTPQAPNTVIGSAMFNSAMDDIAQTFNTPQPIEYGGTNAATAVAALANLGAVSLTATETVAGVKTFSSNPVVSGGGVTFPATQVPSANVNTLDDYEEGTWVANVTFATPGDLSVSYAVRTATYTKIGRSVTVTFNITTATFTHTTASGALIVTGLPFTSIAGVGSTGGGYISGYTKANYTMVSASADASSTILRFIASGSGQVVTGLTTADVPSGGTVSLYYTLTYDAAS